MKKILILFAAILAASCTKQEEFATLSFGVKGVEVHSFTKATADDVRALIATKIPSSVTLTLARTKTGKTYSVATGESITLPIGEYTVKGSVTPSSTTGFPRQGMWSAETAGISINEKVTVVSGTDTYALTPTFTCFAIATSEDVASFSWKHGSASGSATDLTFFGWDNDYELSVTAKPTDYDAKDDAVFVFGGTGIQAQNGKFYILHPESVTTEEGGFTFNTGNWTEGQL